MGFWFLAVQTSIKHSEKVQFIDNTERCVFLLYQAIWATYIFNIIKIEHNSKP